MTFVNPSNTRSLIHNYAAAFGLVTAAAGLRWLLGPALQAHAPFLLFLLATTLATLYGGAGPGLLVLVLGLALHDFLFLEPHYKLGPDGTAAWIYWGAMALQGGVFILVAEALRRAKARAAGAMQLTQTRGEQLRRGLRDQAEAEARIRDLTAALEAMKKAREENAELVASRAALEAANRELEAFSYSVSHDLRAPLRSITGFSQALLEDYAERLDEQGLRYLRYAHEAGLRLSRLIDDLIVLSRATRVDLRRQEIDLSQLAASVLAEFRRREPNRSVQATIAPGLRVHGDEGLLRIAMENLLGNAWKFTSRRSMAQIEFGTVEKEGRRFLYVRDNGAGFDLPSANRLFVVFQRFHSQEEFPGTGIGLATVRRILNRHGGEIRAEAKVDEGATFYFTVPNEPEANGAIKHIGPVESLEPSGRGLKSPLAFIS